MFRIAPAMVRDDLQACLQAYQFAELLLGGFAAKPEKEREQALEAAARLRDEVESRYEAAKLDTFYSAEQLQALEEARAQIERKLREARARSVPPGRANG